MLKPGRWAAFAAIAVAVWIGAAPLCAIGFAADDMPCCRAGASHCNTGMRPAGCCRAEEAPAASGSAVVGAPRTAAPALQAAQGAPADPPASIGTSRPWLSALAPLHNDPPPLYLLHASLLI